MEQDCSLSRTNAYFATDKALKNVITQIFIAHFLVTKLPECCIQTYYKTEMSYNARN